MMHNHLRYVGSMILRFVYSTAAYKQSSLSLGSCPSVIFQATTNEDDPPSWTPHGVVSTDDQLFTIAQNRQSPTTNQPSHATHCFLA